MRVLSHYPPPIFETKPVRLEIAAPPPIIATPAPVRRPMMASKTIIVDAGHGGQDPGARGVGPLPEKNVTLSIASHVAQRLSAAGYRVVSTRTGDRFIPLDDRAATAERADADLFVSIHADAAPRADVSGATIYIGRNASPESQRAAQRVLAALQRSGVTCRGIRRAGFRVLVGHSRPAMLIECGYLTNYFEARRLCSSAYQAMIAGAIAEGIADHFGR